MDNDISNKTRREKTKYDKTRRDDRARDNRRQVQTKQDMTCEQWEAVPMADNWLAMKYLTVEKT